MTLFNTQTTVLFLFSPLGVNGKKNLNVKGIVRMNMSVVG
jgi:hypothetical protein